MDRITNGPVTVAHLESNLRMTDTWEEAMAYARDFAVEPGEADIACLLGDVYSSGDYKHTPRDYREAATFYHIAARQGQFHAATALAWLVLNGYAAPYMLRDVIAFALEHDADPLGRIGLIMAEATRNPSERPKTR